MSSLNHGGDLRGLEYHARSARNQTGMTGDPVQDTRQLLGLDGMDKARVFAGLLREGLVEFERWLAAQPGEFIDEHSSEQLIDIWLKEQGIAGK